MAGNSCYDWSPVAANNTAASPYGWASNMAPSAVISVGRQEEATLSEFVHSDRRRRGGRCAHRHLRQSAGGADGRDGDPRPRRCIERDDDADAFIGRRRQRAVLYDHEARRRGARGRRHRRQSSRAHPPLQPLRIPAGSLLNPKTSNQSGSGTLGATDFTGNISLTGAEIDEAAVSIASATTTSIWAANANYLTLTGAATITSFGTSVQAGARRRIVCSSTPYLDQFRQSHLPRHAHDIQCFPGDSFEVEDEGSDVARITSYMRFNGYGTASRRPAAL